MGVKKTSTRGTDAATITITTHGITASSLDGLLPSQLGPKGTPQPLNTQIKPFNHSWGGQFQPTSIPNAELSWGVLGC